MRNRFAQRTQRNRLFSANFFEFCLLILDLQIIFKNVAKPLCIKKRIVRRDQGLKSYFKSLLLIYPVIREIGEMMVKEESKAYLHYFVFKMDGFILSSCYSILLRVLVRFFSSLYVGICHSTCRNSNEDNKAGIFQEAMGRQIREQNCGPAKSLRVYPSHGQPEMSCKCIMYLDYFCSLFLMEVFIFMARFKPLERNSFVKVSKWLMGGCKERFVRYALSNDEVRTDFSGTMVQITQRKPCPLPSKRRKKIINSALCLRRSVAGESRHKRSIWRLKIDHR